MPITPHKRLETRLIKQVIGTVLTHTQQDQFSGERHFQKLCRSYLLCGNQTPSLTLGHRRREYCDDLCKQAEYRAREDEKERARLEAERIAQETREIEDVQQRYGPGLSEQTITLLRSIWHRYGTAMLHEAGTAIQREIEPFRKTQSLDQVQHDDLKSAYHEALLTIAERERKIEKQQARNSKQQTQLQEKTTELEQAHKDMRALRKLVAQTVEEYHQIVTQRSTQQNKQS